MKAKLEIEFGNKTCAVKPGKFCMFTLAQSFGTIAVCGLFQNQKLFDKGGWLMRCPQCLKKWPAKEEK